MKEVRCPQVTHTCMHGTSARVAMPRAYLSASYIRIRKVLSTAEIVDEHNPDQELYAA